MLPTSREAPGCCRCIARFPYLASACTHTSDARARAKGVPTSRGLIYRLAVNNNVARGDVSLQAGELHHHARCVRLPPTSSSSPPTSHVHDQGHAGGTSAPPPPAVCGRAMADIWRPVVCRRHSKGAVSRVVELVTRVPDGVSRERRADAQQDNHIASVTAQ
jgi:hypothetical protein